MTKRLTGTVTMNATISERGRLHQNSQLVTVAFMAPGISHSNVLSMISIEVIDIVSVRSAVLPDALGARPILRAPRYVRPYPKAKARTIAKTVCQTFGQRSCAPIAEPKISPMPHPVRQ